jgi:RNA polymerase sigma factor (sigma-70 family)
MKHEWGNQNEIKQVYAKCKCLARQQSRSVGVDADDVLQNAMMRWLAREPKRPTPNSWLYKTVRSVAYDAARCRLRESKYLVHHDSAYTGAICERADEDGFVYAHRYQCESGQPENDSSLQQQLAKVLMQLSDGLRMTLMLSAEGYTYTQIADITGVSIGTVRSRLHNARKQARALLAE